MTDQQLKQYADQRRAWCQQHAEKLHTRLADQLCRVNHYQMYVSLTWHDMEVKRLDENDARDIAYVFNETSKLRAYTTGGVTDRREVRVNIPTLADIARLQKPVEAEHNDVRLE